ncbi:hypothetical protein ABZ470_31900 [Streptosporangium sp. NPDC020072]|uniref:hypothetical protein n=1 Tax=Streptosporangium sp. NPDC020072 TaxID=3154788 RepID=UPI00343ACBDE
MKPITLEVPEPDHPIYIYELTPEQISAIYASNNWYVIDALAKNGIPSPSEIEAIIGRLIDGLETESHGREDLYNACARLLVFRDPEFPKSYEVYLQVAYVDMEPLGDE